jgi:hypothetical protein
MSKLTNPLGLFLPADEMDEFEQWQNEQAMAAQTGGQGSMDDGDIMDPADIPLCNEYAATGGCSAGEECCYIHGDQCEVGRDVHSGLR